MLTAGGLTVRQASPLDAPILAGLHRDCFQRPWDETVMAQFAAAPGTLCLIGSVGAGTSSVAAGLVIARKADVEAEILTFGNEAALRLYRSCGAEPVGHRQGYYDHGADSAIFGLAL